MEKKVKPPAKRTIALLKPPPSEYPMEAKYLEALLSQLRTRESKEAVKKALIKYRKDCAAAEKKLINAILKHR